MKLWKKLLIPTMIAVGFVLACEQSIYIVTSGLLLMIWAIVLSFHWMFGAGASAPGEAGKEQG